MIEQGFNSMDAIVKDMTNIFETRVENLDPKEDKKNFTSSKQKV